MRLQSRFALIVGAITTVISISIGFFAITTAYNSEIRQVDSIITRVTSELDERDPLSSAVFLAGENDSQLIVALIDSSGSVVTVRTSADGEDFELAASVTKDVINQIGTIGGEERYRAISLGLEKDSFLVLAIPIREIEGNRLRNVERLGLFLAIALLVAFVVTRILTRPDIRKIERLAERAREIAEGKNWSAVINVQGNSEVDDLSKALNQMVGYLHDALEGERRNSQKMQEFVGDASHELRTPLTVIKGYVELLGRSESLEPQARARAIERLGSEISRMERLISDLLLLAEIGEARGGILDDAINLSDITRVQLTDLKLLDPNREVEDSVTAEVFILGSLPHIQQLIANIFSNIRRHTPAGAPVYVHLGYESQGVRLTIGDGGPGLPHEAYTSGIQQFQRFDTSRSRESGGSGLGMSIMQAIVTEHGGTLTLGPS
ncbi:MAG: sensor histidine kinase, partial [Actinomycetota bacterium]